MSDLAEKLAGKFIVLDGPDGSGKTTQLGLLADWLGQAGLAVLTTRDPGGTDIGERIRAILLDPKCHEMAVGCEVMLYMASRAQLMAEVIGPSLKKNQCVLCDRWVASTFAYQVAAGTRPENVLRAYKAALLDTWPDLTVILDLPAEAGLARLAGSPDRMESKVLAFHRKVRELFLAHAAGAPQRFAVVDAAGDVDGIAARIRELLEGWAFT